MDKILTIHITEKIDEVDLENEMESICSGIQNFRNSNYDLFTPVEGVVVTKPDTFDSEDS